MADTCIIKEGEIVLLDDPRLSDPNCTIEPGAIIRPPVDEAAVEEPLPAPKKIVKAKPVPKPVDTPQPAPELPPAPVEKIVELPKVQAHTEVPSNPPPKKEAGSFSITPEAAMVAAGVTAVAAVGGAVATSAMGGVSAVQAKIASLFGSKATAAATVAGVTAGTIVAVKALEMKMGKLETDMKKAKEDVDGAASSIDRIDELLSRLSNDNDDKLDPSI